MHLNLLSFDLLEGFSNLYSILNNVFDLIYSFFNKIGDSIADLWNFITDITSYVSVITNIISKFLHPSLIGILIAIISLAVIKIIIGRGD